MASPVPPVLPGPLPEVEEVSDFLSARGDIPNDKKRMFIFRHTVTLKNFKSALERWDSITDNEKRLWIAYRGRFMARFPPQPIAAQPKATHKSLAIGDAPPPLDVNAPLSPTAELAHPTDPMQCLSQPPIKDEAVDTNQLASFCSPVPSIRSETPVSPTVSTTCR